MTGNAFIRAAGGAVEVDQAARTAPDAIAAMTLTQLIGRSTWRVVLMHDRPENVLLWITRGQGRIFINGVRRGIGAHNAVFLPKGTLFALDLSPQSLAHVVISPPGRTGLLPRAPLHLRVRDALAQAELTGQIEAMEREIGLQRPHLQEALAQHLGLIAVWLRRQDGAGLADSPKRTAAHRLAHRFANDVVQYYGTDRVMQDYAASLGVTPTHLTRVCRECAGFTAADILSARKLHEAWRRLEDTGEKIQDIARATGFNSPAYFTRFIQTQTGLNPTSLRQAAKAR